MNHTPFRVIVADWARDHEALRRIRETVFVREQHVPVELEWDGLDARCDHVLALDTADTPIGTGRLTAGHRIGRMAVLPDWRSRGVGAAMLHALIECAHAHRWPRVTLHAQADAIGFYRRFGFTGHGDEFVEAGIRHQWMYLDLGLPDST